MEEYRHRVINSHAIQSQNISKFTGFPQTFADCGSTVEVDLAALRGLLGARTCARGGRIDNFRFREGSCPVLMRLCRRRGVLKGLRLERSS